MAQWMIYTKRADFPALSVKHNITPVTARIMTNREYCRRILKAI